MNVATQSIAAVLSFLLSFSLTLRAASAEPESPPADTSIMPPEAESAPMPATPADINPVKIVTPYSVTKIGLLAQPQFESAGAPVGDGMSENLYLRRIRILIGGTLFGDFEYFVDTDSPNLLKGAGNGAKTSSAMFIQDAFVSYKILKDMVKVDAGYMLPPLAHNAVQGATTLYSWDYFANSFLHSNLFDNAVAPVGRDAGVQIRGLVLDGHLEYRVGMFQGKRDPEDVIGGPIKEVVGRNFFRVAGRLQINILDPETGFFYSGTYLGAKRIFSIGAAYDFQYSSPEYYKYWAVDGFLDLPVGPGEVTAQVNLAQWNGGSLATLTNPLVSAAAHQTALMAEAGYRFADLQLGPIGHFEQLWVPDPSGGTTDLTETRYGGGVAWWVHGHNSNLKAFYTRVHPTTTGQQDYNLVNVQWQLYFF